MARSRKSKPAKATTVHRRAKQAFSDPDTRQKVVPHDSAVTMRAIRDVIPDHCFQPSYTYALFLVFRDFLCAGFFMYFGTFIHTIPLAPLRWIAWGVHSWIVGNFFWGIWILAHDCGHESFTPNQWVNDALGFFMHSILCTPYFAWKYSHAQHHGRCNDVKGDTAFVPQKVLHQATWPQAWVELNRSPLFRTVQLVVILPLGFPIYLLFNLMGNKDGSWKNHFNPLSTMFRTNSMRIGAVVGNAGLVAWGCVLYQLTQTYGFQNMFLFYWLPYFQMNIWLSMSTFLHHTDKRIPRYEGDEWFHLRGAIGSVDRDFGVLNEVHHNLPQCHVLHHIFSKIPSYRLPEATSAVISSGLIDEFRIVDDKSPYVALWECYRDCWGIDGSEETYWFQPGPIFD